MDQWFLEAVETVPDSLSGSALGLAAFSSQFGAIFNFTKAHFSVPATFH